MAMILATTAAAQSARAQVAEQNMSIKIDGESPEAPQNIIYLNAKQCGVEGNAEIEVKLQKLPSANFLEVWVNNGTSSDCNTAAARTPPTTGGTPPCTRVGETIMNPISVGTQTVNLTALDLFGEGEDKSTCKSGAQKVYFVPLNNQTTDATMGNPESLSAAPIVLTLTVDVVAPAPVTSVKASDGESQLGASWKQGAETKFLEYRLYFDTSGISEKGAECASEVLVEDKPVPGDADPERATSQGTNGSKNPESLGMSVGEQIPVAVTLVDLAGNESNLSEVVCAAYVDTEGFLDRYKNQGGDGLTECSAHLWKSKSFSPLAAFFLLALGLMARRRLS
jgi:hypothetical protein